MAVLALVSISLRGRGVDDKMMNDMIHYMALRAVVRFGTEGEKNVFNAACFSQAISDITGVKGETDGRVIQALLTGRQDIEIMSGGSHYKLLE